MRILKADHLLYLLIICMEVSEPWIEEYLCFFFKLEKVNNISLCSEPVYIIEKKVNQLEVSFQNRKMICEKKTENIFGKLTTWINGVINDLLYRNGVMVFHGSSCLLDEKAHIFIGKRGNGKTTLIKKLIDKGAVFISDDNVYYCQNDKKIYPSYLGMRIKDNQPIDESKLSILRFQNSYVTFCQPKERCNSGISAVQVFFLSDEYMGECVNMAFDKGIHVLLENIKNANSGKVFMKALVDFYKLSNPYIMNPFLMSDAELIRYD